jgi:Coenzyme PQQ synthesis protein D (PqqD)
MNYLINGEISSKEIGGELFIYNRRNSTISSFNGTGAFIWSLMSRGLPLEEICAQLIKEYDASSTQAFADVFSFVDSLRTNSLITIQEE